MRWTRSPAFIVLIALVDVVVVVLAYLMMHRGSYDGRSEVASRAWVATSFKGAPEEGEGTRAPGGEAGSSW